MEQQPPETPQQPSPAQPPQPEQPYDAPPAYGAPPYGPPTGAPGYPPQPYGPPPGYPMPPASTPPGYYGVPPTGAPGYPPQPYSQQPYSQQPPMPGAPYPYPYPYQQPPMPASGAGPSRGLLWALLSLGVVVVVVVAIVGVTIIAPKQSSSLPGGTTGDNSTYTAAIPGPGCDTHGGVWKAEFDTQTSCLSSGLHVTTTTVGNVVFSGASATSTFPQNYEVSVDVAPSDALDAGLVYHQVSASENGYEFGIDANGSWSVYDRHGNANSSLPYGSVTAATQYHLDVIVNGATQTLSIDGTQVKQFTDTEFTGGDSIGLIVYGSGNSGGHADFKNFVFKKLP